VEEAVAKCESVEKCKQRLTGEIGELAVEVERAHVSATAMERRQRQFERLVGEWRQKCADLGGELAASQGEARLLGGEAARARAQRQEALESVGALRAENGLLAAEIGALVEEVGAGGRRVQVSMGLTDKFFWFCIYRHMLGKVFLGKN
jgi:chromosome segregation ATPase